jgi:hypothetical protein
LKACASRQEKPSFCHNNGAAQPARIGHPRRFVPGGENQLAGPAHLPTPAQWNFSARLFVTLNNMEPPYSKSWVEAQVAQAIELWNGCASRSVPPCPRYTPHEQHTHEKAYDKGLRDVQRQARRAPRNPAERLLAQQRIVALFPGFAATALGIESQAVQLLTNSFLPVATQLARWARSFDATLSMDDTIQACRNAWTSCGLQALLGQPMELTPSILAYSLLYPYSDNYLDRSGVSTANKLHFSRRFRQRLCGQRLSACNPHEAAVWALVRLIEEQFPRPHYGQVFDCLLAIHGAQEQSIAQLKNGGRCHNSVDNCEVLRISCAKGGTSVLADACLAQPWLTQEESRFSFEWGVLLQLGDDLQDVREDLRRGSATLFTRAAAQGKPLDSLVMQLLNLSHQVAGRMDRLPNGTPALNNLLRMSWRSLILMAVADAHQFFSPPFLAELEPFSSFRFNFLRARNEKLTGHHAVYAALFDAFLEAGAGDQSGIPLPGESSLAPDLQAVAELPALCNSFA